jgi:cyclase
LLKTRIIPMLLLRQGRMVKGKRFSDYRDTGDPISAARIYNAQRADELAFIDIDATSDGRRTLFHVIEAVSRECFMPLTVGGGIQSPTDVRDLLNAGADKVLINSAAVERPELVGEVAAIFGNQCVVAGIDVVRDNGSYRIYSHGGRVRTEVEITSHIRQLEQAGAGEILINSIDNDGMMSGYDIDLLRLATATAGIPVIAAGGAGNFQHLVEAIQTAHVHAVACASLFHFGDNNPIRARAYLKNRGIAVKET